MINVRPWSYYGSFSKVQLRCVIRKPTYAQCSAVKTNDPRRGGGGVTPTEGLVSVCLPWLWVNFAIFCPDHGSCFVNLALFMGLFWRDLP